MTQQKDNSGALFHNDRREKDTHPHYKGNIMVDGVEYWISAWVNTSKDGKKYMSLAVTPKQTSGNIAEDDDDMPF